MSVSVYVAWVAAEKKGEKRGNFGAAVVVVYILEIVNLRLMLRFPTFGFALLLFFDPMFPKSRFTLTGLSLCGCPVRASCETKVASQQSSPP